MERLAQKKPVSNSSSPPVQKGVSWQRPFSDLVYDAVSPKQEETAPPEITPRAGFNLTQMKIFPDAPAAGVQAKLTVGAPGDKYEQEADAMAGKVMAMPAPENEEPIQRETAPEEKKEDEVQAKPLESSSIQREMAPEEKEEEVQTKSPESSSIQRETAPEEKKEEETPVQAKAAPEGNSQTSGNLESQLNGSKGGGSPLPDDVRSFMEPRFGADFSGVRVHTDGEAVQMNKELGAQAFAHGSDIYYGAGKSPGKNELTAHELTHVVQQTGGVQTKFLSNQLTVQRKCPACEAEDRNLEEPKLQTKETEQSSLPKPLIDAATEPNDPNANLDRAIKIVQQTLDASTETPDKGGAKEAGSFDVEKQKQGLMTVLNHLHSLKESGNVDEIRKVTQPIFAAAKGDLETANQLQQQDSTQVNSRQGSTPSIQRFAQAAAAPALIGAGPVGWAILGIVGVAAVGYLAYQASRSLPETQTIPRSSSRRRGVSCRCKARYTGGENPPDHCPKIVEGVGADNREAQKNAKWSAPEECRKFYGHCDCRPL